MTIRSQIETQNLFTASEKSVANYILERPQSISDMSIHDLAQVTYTSTPTVLRVCRKLGYEGYRQFKKALLLELENEKHLLTQIDASRPFYKEVDGVAQDILTADRFFIYAVGDTRITCSLFANKLLKLNIHPVFATENYQEMEETYNLKKGDYALFVSYKGMNERLADCAAVLKRRGIKTCLITCNAQSPLVPLCSALLLLPDTEKINKIATFHSQISIGFTLNLLYSLIYEKDYEGNKQHKEVLDKVSY